MNNYEDIWIDNYNRITGIIKEKGKLPNTCISEKMWLTRQRTKYNKGKLSDRRVALMEKAKLLPENDISKNEIKWFDNYNKVIQIINDIGELPNTCISEKMWLARQRTKYNKGKLSDRRAALMKGAKLLSENDISKNEIRWIDNYNRVINIIKNTGGLANTYVSETMWLFAQRTKYNKGKLSDEKVTLMKKANLFQSFNSTGNEKKWLKRYQAVIEIISEIGKLPRNSISEKRWLSAQKTKYNKGLLSENRIQMLNMYNLLE